MRQHRNLAQQLLNRVRFLSLALSPVLAPVTTLSHPSRAWASATSVAIATNAVAVPVPQAADATTNAVAVPVPQVQVRVVSVLPAVKVVLVPQAVTAVLAPQAVGVITSDLPAVRAVNVLQVTTAHPVPHTQTVAVLTVLHRT